MGFKQLTTGRWKLSKGLLTCPCLLWWPAPVPTQTVQTRWPWPQRPHPGCPLTQTGPGLTQDAGSCCCCCWEAISAASSAVDIRTPGVHPPFIGASPNPTDLIPQEQQEMQSMKPNSALRGAQQQQHSSASGSSSSIHCAAVCGSTQTCPPLVLSTAHTGKDSKVLFYNSMSVAHICYTLRSPAYTYQGWFRKSRSRHW
jgi:hypothetical protein